MEVMDFRLLQKGYCFAIISELGPEQLDTAIRELKKMITHKRELEEHYKSKPRRVRR